MTTTTNEGEPVDAEILGASALPQDAAEGSITLYENAVPAAETVDMKVLQDLGFISPIAKPDQLRAAFDYQQKMFAAILSDSDYIYQVSWKDGRKTEQRIFGDKAEALALFEKFAHLNSHFNAKPKKSGIVKLARALGISATRKRVSGLPDDPVAQFSYVEYEAVHEGTGKSEIGVGWCDKSERGGKISTHDVIATADTRAYNRAVLRLAGFGDVSADEMVAGASDSDDPLPVTIPQTPTQKEMADLPPIEDDDVQTASRAWAEAIVERKERKGRPFAPEAQQDTRMAREMRALARRGHSREGTKLGATGLKWSGTACDGVGYPTFTVEAPPVAIEDVEKAAAAAQEATGANGADVEKKGWDLSGKGSDKDDEDLPPDIADAAEPRKASTGLSIPGPSPAAETITTKQAKNVSGYLKKLFTDKAKMKTWLKNECHVESSIHIRSNQYEPIIAALKTLTEKEK